MIVLKDIAQQTRMLRDEAFDRSARRIAAAVVNDDEFAVVSSIPLLCQQRLQRPRQRGGAIACANDDTQLH